MPDGSHLVFYANDVAALILEIIIVQSQIYLGMVMRGVNTWLRDYNLPSLAHNKVSLSLGMKIFLPKLTFIQTLIG